MPSPSPTCFTPLCVPWVRALFHGGVRSGQIRYGADPHRRHRERHDVGVETLVLHERQHVEALVRRRQLWQRHIAGEVLDDLAHGRARGGQRVRAQQAEPQHEASLALEEVVLQARVHGVRDGASASGPTPSPLAPVGCRARPAPRASSRTPPPA